MKIEKIDVYGFSHAIRAMRNPMDSWDKNDSEILSGESVEEITNKLQRVNNFEPNSEYFILGQQDKLLSQKLSAGGGSHRKHLRLISVWADITAPRFWWIEATTYHYIEMLSTSTMHTILKYPINRNMFEDPKTITENQLMWMELYRKQENKLALKNALPEGFLQMRTICTNYETLFTIKQQREHHELPQWDTFIKFIDKLPYFLALTGLNAKGEIE